MALARLSSATLIAILLTVVTVGFWIVAMRVPTEVFATFGGGSVLIGTWNIAFSRRIARQAIGAGRKASGPGSLWYRVDELEIVALFRIIGGLLLLGGLTIFAVGVWRS